MPQPDLLPPNATSLERALSLAIDPGPQVDAVIAALPGLKIVNPPPSFLPFLVYEYGLGELTPYLPNLYQLIDDGVRWQRVRGTPAAVAKGLGWLGYAATIEEPPPRRIRWTNFELALDRVRDADTDLIRIEGIAQLSVPVRSVFWRGYHGYDIRALEGGRTRWSGALWSSYSGTRLAPGTVKWSFGRRIEVDHALTDAELAALGVYLPPAGAQLGWGAFPWQAVPWTSSAALTRSVAMLAATSIGTAWAVFKDGTGAVIGYRRARAAHRVAQVSAGLYRLGASQFNLKPSGATMIYLEALTGFGDGADRVAASVGFHLSGAPAAGYPPGALWLPAGGLVTSAPVIGASTVSIAFGRTVRERVAAILRF